MPVAPHLRQRDLTLAFPEPVPVLFGMFRAAGGAADALLEHRISAVLFSQGTAAGAAACQIAGAQAMPHRNPPIEDKAFALPKAFRLWHLLQIFQDAALQMKDIFNALAQQPVR